MSSQRWSTDLGFMLGAVGAAVGLGSIWRFPYLTGAGGGFAFILVFVIACLVFGAPILVGEAILGRWSRATPQRSAGDIAARFGYSRGWDVVGWTGPVAGFLVTSYYTMIAGWVLAYTWLFLSGQYARGGVVASSARFQALISDSGAASLWQLAFFVLVAAFSVRGVNRGVELANRWRAPALLAILLVLVAYSLATGDVGRGLAFAFAPDFSRLTPQVLLAAVGQAFYALGICVGVMIVYGSYMPANESLTRSVVAVIGSILVVSALATVAIFPLVFHYGLNPAGGPELVFQVLPVAFAAMPGGRWIGTLFFALLVLAAFTPTMALMEVWVAWLVERFQARRGIAVAVAFGSCFVVGQASIQAFGATRNVHPLAHLPRFAAMNAFDLIDFLTANVLMPVSALLVSIFLGWRLGARVPATEFSGLGASSRWLLVFALRYLCPAGIVVVLTVGLVG